MKRPRPYIPLAVRVEVAERYVNKDVWWQLYCGAVEAGGMTLGRRMAILMGHMPKGAQLDHDPALILRPFDEATGKYTPDANDPAYLIYRDAPDHLQKTTGRKPGATHTVTTKGSDIGVKTKFARLERKARQTIKPKGFGGTRKLQGRAFPTTQKRPFR